MVTLKDGTRHVTPNRVRPCSIKIKRFQSDTMLRLAKERGINIVQATDDQIRELRTLMRQEYYAYYRDLQARHVNNAAEGWGLLNGQPTVEDLWCYQSYARSDVAEVLLFSDGFVGGMIDSHSDDLVGDTISQFFHVVGLHGILAHTRIREERVKETSTITNAEATAIALTF